MKIAALVVSDEIINCIVLDDTDEISGLAALYNVDECIDVTNMDPQPWIGWTRDSSGDWQPPPPPEPVEPISE